MKSRFLLWSVLVLPCLFQAVNSQEKKTPEVYGLKIGEKMPFHVVDFFAGARTKGGGCPSVMISNSQAQGVEIWSRTDDDQPFQLACALEAKLDDSDYRKAKKQGYLILFNDSLKKAIAANPDALKKFHVAVPREITNKWFEKAGLSGKAGTVVFLLNRKDITATWAFAPGELNDERIQAIVKKFAAEKQNQPKDKLSSPTYENIKYGPHERNVLDFWQARSEQPTPVLVAIHGGGFLTGDKSVSPQILKQCLDSGISVAAINYRYSTQAIAPAPFHDGARAVQFLRTKAKDWNIDPKRFAATGGSAGAGISLWLGFHKDMADPKNDDPVLRQSTRLTCMVVFNGQTSYDPRVIRKLFPGKDIYKHGALQKLFDFEPSKLDDLPAEKYRLFEEVSAINHVTKDAPPVLLWYNNPIDAEVVNQGIGIHHPLFGKMLKEKMDGLGIPCEVVAEERRIGGGTPTRTIDFLKEHFGLKK